MGLVSKVELKEKGKSNPIDVKQLMCTLKWTSADDFDLAAIYVKKDKSLGMIFYGAKGSLATFPYMSLDEDAGVGGTAGDNEENLRIAKLSGVEEVYLVCWDFEAARASKPANFKNSDVRLSIKDQNGNEVEATLVVDGGSFNGTVVAKLLVNESMGMAEMVNVSKGFTLLSTDDNGKSIISQVK